MNVFVRQYLACLQSQWDISLAHRMGPEGQAMAWPEREKGVGEEKGRWFEVW